MELRKGELRIFYGGGKINSSLDAALRKVLASYDYEWWASGCDLINGVRDLAFDQSLVEETVGDWDKEDAKLCIKGGVI